MYFAIASHRYGSVLQLCLVIRVFVNKNKGMLLFVFGSLEYTPDCGILF